ncbi:pilin [Patescibacteria group bacterium]|nr:pilin [Patescibacteria group bacterium]
MKAIARFFFRHKYSFLLLLFLATPLYIYAQSVGANGLVPCGAVSSSNYSLLNPSYYLQATSCNFCYFAKLIQNIVNFLVMVTIPISVGMFAWAGILFFTNAGNPKRIARARSIFRSVLIGFIITITGWLVVQVVLQSITNPNFYSANNWVNLDCSEYNQFRSRNVDISSVLTPTVAPTAPSTEYPYPPGTGTPATSGPTPSGGQLQDQINRGILESSGVPVTSSGNCNDAGSSSCTALDKVNSNVISAVVDLKNNSGQQITVSGGNEVGHQNSEQQNGNSVDISFKDSSLNTNAAAINSVIQAARAQGQCAVWEPGIGNSCPAGVTSRCLTGYGTGGHFSLYMSPSASPSCGN